MSTVVVPAPGDMAAAVAMLEAGLGFLADMDKAGMPVAALADGLQALERADAIAAAARGGMLAAFDAQDGSVADGQRTVRTWLVHSTRVTRGQAGEHKAVQALAEGHRVLLAGLREGGVITKSVALQLARWIAAIPREFREQTEEIVVTAARAGADLRALAAICAEIRYRTAPPDPDGQDDRHLDRGVSLDTTIDGAGVVRGDLTPECTALVTAVLDALSAPEGAGDLRTRPQRYHDALAEAMRRLLSSDLLPKRAGQPVKALVHVHVAELLDLDQDSILQDKWIAEYRARWAAHRAAASVSRGDGGAWLEGDAARVMACDAMIVPVVIGDIDPGAVEVLIGLCVQYDRLRAHAASRADGPLDLDGTGGPDTPAGTYASDGPNLPEGTHASDGPNVPEGIDTSDGEDVLADAGTSPAENAQSAAGTAADVLAMLEHQILAQVLQVVSGPGGVASFLRRNLLGKGLNGPSLPLDVGQTDDIPTHLRRLVALRDQTCRHPGGCDQPASGCEPHHIQHREDGGRTSLTNLKDYCHWHHHVLLHRMGWTLTVHPDGTSQVRSPGGKIIRSHSPPPRPR
jgi:Domain of unknown function (DUF222)